MWVCPLLLCFVKQCETKNADMVNFFARFGIALRPGRSRDYVTATYQKGSLGIILWQSSSIKYYLLDVKFLIFIGPTWLPTVTRGCYVNVPAIFGDPNERRFFINIGSNAISEFPHPFCFF